MGISSPVSSENRSRFQADAIAWACLATAGACVLWGGIVAVRGGDTPLASNAGLPIAAGACLALGVWGRWHRLSSSATRRLLLRSRERYDAAHDRARLMELAASGVDSLVVITDRYGVIEWVNDRFTRVSGYRLDQAVGKKLGQLVNGPNTDAQALAYIQRRFSLGKPFACEISNRSRDGADYWVAMNVQPVYEDAGLTHWISTETEITHSKETEQRLHHDATHDTLTGLANRANVLDRLTLALARQRREKDRLFAVLFLDLDRFKFINDTMGHAVGDGLLVEVAQRLSRSVRETDAVAHNDRRVVARFGGDEFILLLDDISHVSDAVRVAQRVLETLGEPYKIDGVDISTTASIGIAVCGDAAQEPEDVLRNADLAMYQAKNAGKARYAIFDQAMHDDAVDRLELEADLKTAIRSDDQIHVAYQPIVEMPTQRLIGFEALVRWRHPERGLITPERFVTIAEETGLIHKLGQMVLWESCRQLKRWHDLGEAAERLSVNANLSRVQILQSEIVDVVDRALEETRLDPRRLKLEITEASVMNPTTRSLDLLGRLRDRGIKMVMDDFGAGYSSLSLLHEFPIDELKIDQAFIRNMDSDPRHAATVECIITLAHHLGIEVTAEGIETLDELKTLDAFECDRVQGYYYGRPMTAQEATALIRGLNLDAPLTSAAERAAQRVFR
ncbi:MAG: putative bifunctional diguanylate cyclase/phosphodiesterase [Planctomycetota bacterium]|jgi:diguanylate cyclase (GGDEF)-like protein/PAS domain S-box-containing protein